VALTTRTTRAFDAAAQLAVYNAAGQQVTSTDVAYSGEDPVPVELNDPCFDRTTHGVCEDRGLRTCVHPTSNCWWVYDQLSTVLRTPAMVNLNGQQGLTCTASIPGPPLSTNSSPRFGDLPAIALCLDQPTTIDFSATDPDGDQLVYGLCAPFIGGTATDPAPFPSAPPYTQVTYAAGYSAAQPVDSDPPHVHRPEHRAIADHPRRSKACSRSGSV
jgi:hypothetical protein